MTKATHWIPSESDFDDTGLQPSVDPCEAAKAVLDSWSGNVDDLLSDGSITVEVRGCYLTNEPVLDVNDEDAPDGYTPGAMYWKNTNDYKKVKIAITATLDS